MKKFLIIFFISMVPLVELRGAIPIAVGMGLPVIPSIIVSVIGNMLPVPFILLFIEHVFSFLKKNVPRMNSFIGRLEERAAEKQKTVDKYGALGLVLLVAIPLPGTGAWTGSLVAALMGMKRKKAVPLIFVGVVIAAVLMTVITKLGVYAFF